ncbi:MAG: O-methyltransferase [Sediminibacterium sp.]
MYSPIQRASKYLYYYITAKNGKGHGVHSPFVFDFIQHVLNDDRYFYAYQPIENVGKLMLNDTRVLSVEDFATGSRTGVTNQRTVSYFAKSALKSVKFGQLLFRIIDHYAPEYLLELGTSLGITSAYLAMANPSATLTTMEGSTAIAAVAKENFQKLGIKNIRLIEGDFDHTLPAWLENKPIIDFALIDINLRYASTIHYFYQLLDHTHEYSMLIFDHIHGSAEMEKAWDEIQQHPVVTLTIDLFFIGIVFFRKEFKVKQHLAIRF